MGNVSRKTSTTEPEEELRKESSSSRRLSQPNVDETRRRRSSCTSVVTVTAQTEGTYDKWFDDPFMDNKRLGAHQSEASANRAEIGVFSSCSSRYLTADNAGNDNRKLRPRSMSARKSDESRPRVELTPKQTVGGSVRMRRTSDTVNEIGQLRVTPAQIALVRRLWQNVRTQGENGAGLQILRDHLFFRYPDIRGLFSKPSGSCPVASSSADINYHKRLMTHAEALGGLLDEVIANLEHSDLLREKIRDLGRLHVKSRDVGFKAAYWDYLAEAFNECTLAWCQRAQRSFETQVAMMTIVMFIIDHLKDGYMTECRRLRRSVYDSESRERKHDHSHEHRDLSKSPRRLAVNRTE